MTAYNFRWSQSFCTPVMGTEFATMLQPTPREFSQRITKTRPKAVNAFRLAVFSANLPLEQKKGLRSKFCLDREFKDIFSERLIW